MPSPQFFNLPEAKQDQIIHASLREFAEHGYDLASTNRIVERAAISKGVLFKYFIDKEALFLYVCDLCLKDYADAMPWDHAGDLFEWIRTATLYKMRFIRERPLTYQLLIRITKEPRHPVYAQVVAAQAKLMERFTGQLQAALPPDALRPGLTWQQVLGFVTWIGYGLQEKYAASIPDVVDDGFEQSFEPMIRELDIFLEILKFGIYKEGATND